MPSNEQLPALVAVPINPQATKHCSQCKSLMQKQGFAMGCNHYSLCCSRGCLLAHAQSCEVDNRQMIPKYCTACKKRVLTTEFPLACSPDKLCCSRGCMLKHAQSCEVDRRQVIPEYCEACKKPTLQTEFPLACSPDKLCCSQDCLAEHARACVADFKTLEPRPSPRYYLAWEFSAKRRNPNFKWMFTTRITPPPCAQCAMCIACDTCHECCPFDTSFAKLRLFALEDIRNLMPPLTGPSAPYQSVVHLTAGGSTPHVAFYSFNKTILKFCKENRSIWEMLKCASRRTRASFPRPSSHLIGPYVVVGVVNPGGNCQKNFRIRDIENADVQRILQFFAERSSARPSVTIADTDPETRRRNDINDMAKILFGE